MKDYKQLDAWKAAMQLVAEIYQLTKHYPKEEQYALTSQTKRAAISIPVNIAEGLGRQYKKDTLQFLHISRGSLYELETLLIIGRDTDNLPEAKFKEVEKTWQKGIQLLNGFINYYEKAELK